MTALTGAERERLARIADLLIPRSAHMPSGSEADAHGAYLDAVFGVRPDLVPTVHDGLDRAPDPLPDRFDPEQIAVLRPLADALTAAYFLNPDVARRVGYRKRSVIPIRFDDDLDDLVVAVVARGPIYRPTPSSEEN